MRNWLPDLRTLYALCYIYAISHMCIYIYIWIYMYVYVYVYTLSCARCKYVLFRKCQSLRDNISCVGQPFIFFRDLQYMKQQWYSNGALNRNPDQIRDTRRLPLFWFKTYRRVSSRGVSWSGDWLQIFVFSLSFSSTRYALFPCLAHVLTKPVLKS